MADIVAGFGRAALGPAATLYLRVAPSLVFQPADDRSILEGIRAEQRGCADPTLVEIDERPRRGTDYRDWAVYVSASEYEGVSMTPLEAILQGCPVLMSDIAPHRHIVSELFAGRSDDVLFPVGDRDALAGLIRHEVLTGERRADVRARTRHIHETIEGAWSLHRTARDLAGIALGASTQADVLGGRPS
jgi:hypothetical protein